jgi:hypothetical protein
MPVFTSTGMYDMTSLANHVSEAPQIQLYRGRLRYRFAWESLSLGNVTTDAIEGECGGFLAG